MNKADESEQLLAMLAKRLNTDPQTLQNAIRNGQTEPLLSALAPQEAAKIRPFLTNPNEAARIIATPQAQALIRKWFRR